MTDVRSLLLDTAAAACDLAADPAVTRRWDEPSALPLLSVGALAGHLVATGTHVVVRYLDQPAPDGPVIDAAAYYAAALTTSDLDAELHQGIRARAQAFAADGPDALVAGARAVLADLERRFATEPRDRRVAVAAGLVLELDGYLVTRLLELVVHRDDLAVSVGLPSPEPDPEIFELILTCLVGIARRRHGDLAVLRALTRRERDDVEALRVL